MKTTLLTLLLGLFCLVNNCKAQILDAKSIEKYFKVNQEPFRKVFFSISLTNEILTVSSTNSLHCHIENLSTNNIMLLGQDWRRGNLYLLGIFLTNNTGQFYQLKPKKITIGPIMNTAGAAHSVYAGQIYDWDEPFEIGKDVGIATYQISASQHIITTDGKDSWVFTSSPLDVSVTK